jgi:hypothetical protein
MHETRLHLPVMTLCQNTSQIPLRSYRRWYRRAAGPLRHRAPVRATSRALLVPVAVAHAARGLLLLLARTGLGGRGVVRVVVALVLGRARIS